MSNSVIKCLMIGQAGIGKSTFLSKFPNAKKQIIDELTPQKPKNLATSEWKETYSIEYMNNRFETIRIELDNCDISLETCLRSSNLSQSATVDGDFMSALKREETSSSFNKMMLLPMLPTQSSKFIDIAAYKIIVLCFALDDSHSLELIKSKWEIDLKRNRTQQHSFILIGFKSDLVFSTVKTDNIENVILFLLKANPKLDSLKKIKNVYRIYSLNLY